MAKTDISMNEWLAEFDRVSNRARRQDDGLTMDELCGRMGYGPNKMGKMLRQAIADGKVVQGWKSCTSITKRRYMAPVYLVVGGKRK